MAGVCLAMSEAQQTAILEGMELTDLWGIAGGLARKLHDLGIRSPLELREAEPSWLRERVGVVVQRLAIELRGTPCQSLTLPRPDNKTILASRSFGRPVVERHEFNEAIASHIARAAEKLRAQHLAAGAVMVFATTNRFKPTDPQYAASRTLALPVATADTMTLTRIAIHAAGLIWRDGYRYKKAGITLLDLGAASCVQGDLWSTPDTPRSRKLMRVMDAINASEGRDMLRLAASGIRRGWSMRSEQRSQRFTTSWDELLEVKG
jgi:DNA polymerase V